MVPDEREGTSIQVVGIQTEKTLDGAGVENIYLYIDRQGEKLLQVGAIVESGSVCGGFHRKQM